MIRWGFLEPGVCSRLGDFHQKTRMKKNLGKWKHPRRKEGHVVSKNKSLTELYDVIMEQGGPTGSITQAIVDEWKRGDDDDPLLRQDTKKIKLASLIKNIK